MKVEPTLKYRIVFLPEAEFDIIRSLIPKDNLETYDALDINKVKNFRLRDSYIVFVSDDYRTLLMHKAKKGEVL